jgi:serine/threonine-protein kinase
VDPNHTIEIPSRRFGKYLVRSRVGEGGMAEIFLAEVVNEHEEVTTVALKLMKKDASREDFAGEADLMGLIRHENLVQRIEVGEAFGRPYIAMEFLMGGDLHSLRHQLANQGERFPTRTAFYVVMEALKGLAYFHQLRTRSGSPLGLVHGDVNPSNIFFSSTGLVKLGDFGVAKSNAMNLGPADGVAAGKLSYLSPEQARGEGLTPASDLFAVGVVLYELVVGQHPFVASPTSHPHSVLDLLRSAKLSVPTSVERPLAQILKRALHHDAASRFQSAGEFAGALLHHALDSANQASREEVGAWLAGVLGILA